MTGIRGRIFACRQRDGVLFRVMGRATADVCPEMRHFAEDCFGVAACPVRVDLRECTHFDSTFLGTLLSFKRRCGDMGIALIDPSPECQQLLRRMVVASLFPVVSDDEYTPIPSAGDGWTILDGTAEPQCVFEFKRNVVDAHQELAQLEGSAGDRFRPLAEAVAREFEAEQAQRQRV